MYSKIAIGNVRKSFKDYTIYFLTLTLAVCIFYSFNSIESQKAIMEMNAAGKEYTEMLIQTIGYISVFVSVILGSLILYANNFLIKRRKKELGIYMTLGMGKSKISRILIIETILVGFISLVSGLLLGIVASQGLSVFTAKLFDVGMSEYSFVISMPAMVKTVLYFGIMFLLVIIFNTFIISKYKIIDLLTAGRKNEDIKFKNPITYFISFIMSIVSLGFAYKLILDIGLDVTNSKFLISIALGILGTILFFFSLAGFILFIVKKNKKVYFKGLNIFVVKQLNSKINTNFISMALICLMLFITMSVLSTGISFKTALEGGLKEATPFDASAVMFIRDEDGIKTIEESLNNLQFSFDDGESYVYYDLYDSNLSLQEMFGDGVSEKGREALGKLYYNANVMKLSHYNDIRALEGRENIELGENEALLLSNMNETTVLEEYLKNNKTVKLKDKDLLIKDNKILKENIQTSYMKNTFPTLVVNDELTNGFEIRDNVLNINYDESNRERSEEKLTTLFTNYRVGKVDYDKVGFISGYTRDQIYAENKGSTTTILFVGIYLGIVFLITSMAVLALQQLSEASDSIDRYKSLKKLGANNKMINKTIFTQTFMYFALPITLALVHSIVGIMVANDFIAMFNKPDIGASSIITALIFIVVYIGYFYATYTGYKNIVKSNL
ncbi:FtsX-like permease family protein [Clostridium sp.]|uniref:FtsX-like permease family protein n=1 Tax=Clostridium sp. TaxID=1506 RepID=UPI003F3FE0D3